MDHLDCEDPLDRLDYRVHRVSKDPREKSDQRVFLEQLEQTEGRERQVRRDQKAPMVRWVPWDRPGLGASAVRQV